MAVPKSKASKAKSRGRRSINMKLNIPTLIECQSCGARIRPHRVCPKCGNYKGNMVVEPEDLA
mgnify:CR=1